MRYAEKLLKQMNAKGLNQQKLAKASNVSDSEVSRILGGKSQPGLENAFRLARAVGVSLDYLADDSLDADLSQAASQSLAEERGLLEMARALGISKALWLLEIARVLGYDVAMRRLLSAEAKPIVEVGDGRHPHTPSASQPEPASAGANGGGSSLPPVVTHANSA